MISFESCNLKSIPIFSCMILMGSSSFAPATRQSILNKISLPLCLVCSSCITKQ